MRKIERAMCAVPEKVKEIKRVRRNQRCKYIKKRIMSHK